MGADHPIAWCQDYEGGRSWYTGGGHTDESYAEPPFRQHLLGGIQTAAGVVDADCGATLTDDFEKVRSTRTPSTRWSSTSPPTAGSSTSSAAARCRSSRPRPAPRSPRPHLDVYTGNEDGLHRHRARPRLRHQPAGSTCTIRPHGGEAAQPGLAVHLRPATRSTWPARRSLLEVPTQRSTCCHAGGDAGLRRRRATSYIATGDNTNPFESDGYAPIDERPGRQNCDAQRTSANTNDLRGKILRIHPEADGTYTIPAGNLFAPGTAKTRPEIYAMGFRNPFRIGVDPATDRLYVADYGPDAGAANPDRGPGGHRRVERRRASRAIYGWPYCTGANTPYIDYDFATGRPARRSTAPAPVNDSPNNTGLTQLPPASAARSGTATAAPRASPRSAAAARRWAGRSTTTTRSSTPTRKLPAYWDGKAFFGEWNQGKVYSFQLTGDGRTTWWTSTGCCRDDRRFDRPMDMRVRARTARCT